jgi:hypothetical protein
MFRVRHLFAAATFCLPFALGCGPDLKLADVSGTITFEGKPVEKGAITFFPIAGNAPTAGASIVDGEYKAQVPFGEMKVAISSPKIVGKRKLYENNPKSPEMDLTAEVLPLRYNEQSELKLEVKERVITKNFELKK